MKKLRCLLVLLVAVVLYLIGAYFLWTGLPWPVPRHILGAGCWPGGFTSDGKQVATYRRWWHTNPNGGGREEATGPVELWDLRTGAVVASFLDEQRYVDYNVELSPAGSPGAGPSRRTGIASARTAAEGERGRRARLRRAAPRFSMVSTVTAWSINTDACQ